MALDAIFGIILVTGIGIALATTVTHERLTEASLADSRSAIHLAERTLLSLQHHQPLPLTPAEFTVTVHTVKDGIAPPGYVWASVDAAVRGHHRSLLGVVPIAMLSPGRKS